jgi:hypothetical protein
MGPTILSNRDAAALAIVKYHPDTPLLIHGVPLATEAVWDAH